MNVFGLSELIWWAILALAGVVAALIGRRTGKLGVIGIFFLAWMALLLYEIVPVPVTAGRWDNIWRTTSFIAFIAMVPMLFVVGRDSVRTSIVWGIGSATFATYGIVILWLTKMHTIPVAQRPCNLPTLETPIPSRTISEIGTTSFFSARCPVPLVTEFEFERDYGVIGMRWRTASHELFVFARTSDGQPLSIGGNRFDKLDATRWSPAPEYAYVENFGQFRYHPDAPGTRTLVPPETFSIAVSQTDGELLEEIEITYRAKSCICAVYSGFWTHEWFKVP